MEMMCKNMEQRRNSDSEKEKIQFEMEPQIFDDREERTQTKENMEVNHHQKLIIK